MARDPAIVAGKIEDGATNAILEEAQHAMRDDDQEWRGLEQGLPFGSSTDNDADRDHAAQLAMAFLNEFQSLNAEKSAWEDPRVKAGEVAPPLLVELFEREVELGAEEPSRDTSPENFGYYLVMEGLGHGVGWWEFRDHDLNVPNLWFDWHDFPGMAEAARVFHAEEGRPQRKAAKRAKKAAGRAKREKKVGKPWFPPRGGKNKTRVEGLGGLGSLETDILDAMAVLFDRYQPLDPDGRVMGVRRTHGGDVQSISYCFWKRSFEWGAIMLAPEREGNSAEWWQRFQWQSQVWPYGRVVESSQVVTDWVTAAHEDTTLGPILRLGWDLAKLGGQLTHELPAFTDARDNAILHFIDTLESPPYRWPAVCYIQYTGFVRGMMEPR